MALITYFRHFILSPFYDATSIDNVLVQYIFECLVILMFCYICWNGILYIWNSYYNSQADSTSDKPLPPGEFGWPFVGETLHFLFKGGRFYNEKLTQYGKIYKTHLLGKPTVRVIGAENIKKVLNGENTLVEASYPKTVQKLFITERSLVGQTGETHRNRKITLKKALAPNTLSYLVADFQNVITSCISTWCQQGEILGSVKCRELAYRLASELLYGFDQEDTESEKIMKNLKIMIDNLFCLPINCPGLAFRKAMKSRSKVVNGIRDLIIQSNNNSATDITCVLDVLKNLKDTESLSDDDLIDMLVELMFAGHHSTSSICCSLLLHLGQNKEILEKIRNELRENGLMDMTTKLTYKQITELTYMDSVVKEALLLKPPVGGGFRKALKTFEIGDYQIPKGWTVIFSVRETHETSPLFPDQNVFNPDRWTDEQLTSQDMRFHYVPFGHGARACPGEHFAKLSIKIFLIEISRRYDWELHNKNPDIKLLPSPYPTDGLPMTVVELKT